MFMSVMCIRAARPILVGAALSLFAANAVLADDELESVVVTAARVEQPISQVIGSVTVITRAEIEKRQVQSVQDLLRGEAGIDIANNGGLGKVSNVFLRGGNSAQTLILVDGVRLGAATNGATSINFIPVDQIERIEIVRGPRSSLYGSDAIGGVIQIFTRKNNGINASVGYGSYGTENYNAGFGMHGDALRFSVNGNYIQSDGFNACSGNPATFQGCFVNEPDDDGYRNTSGSAQLGYAFGKVADIELSTLYAEGFTQFDGFSANEGRFRQSAPTLKLNVTPIDALRITLLGGITEDRMDSFKNSVFSDRYNTKKRNGSLVGDWSITSKHRITVGADYLKDSIDTIVDSTDPTVVFAATTRSSHGEFVQYLGTIASHELSLSARHDQSSQYGGHTTGSAGWKWFVLERALAFNAGYGKAFHAPTFNDLYFPFGSGNPDLKPESSRSIEVGASGMVSWLNWSLQAYDTKVKDLIQLDSNFLPANTDARLKGAELTFNTHVGNTTAAVNYTLLDPRNRQAGANFDKILIRRARQSGRLDLGYDFGSAQIGTTINVAGKRYDNPTNTVVLPGYTTVDFRANVELCKALALQVKLENFFDRQYETVRYYNQAGRTIFVTLRYQPKK